MVHFLTLGQIFGTRIAQAKRTGVKRISKKNIVTKDFADYINVVSGKLAL